MEVSFLYILFFIAPFLTLMLIFSSRNSSINLHLPPGNTGYPYIGETLRFHLMGKRGIPEKFFRDRMNKYSNQVFKTAVFCGASGNKFIFSNENKIVAVSWPSTVKKIFPHTGKTTAGANEILMRLRGNLNKVYSPDSLQKFVGIVDSTTKLHLKNHWNDGNGQVCVLRMVKKFTFSVSCKLFLNIDSDRDDHREKMMEMKDLARRLEVLVAGIYSIPVNFPGTACNFAIRASKTIRKTLQGILRQRKKNISDELDKTYDHSDYMSCLVYWSRFEHG